MTNINYYLRSTAGKQSPIYLFVGVDKLRLRFSTGEKVKSTAWNKTSQRPRLPKLQDSTLETLTNRLNKIESDVTKALSKEAENGSVLSESAIKEIVIACINETEIKVETKTDSFYSFADSFIESSKGIKTAGTIKTYKGTITVLKDFEQSQNYKIDFDTFNLNFFDKFTSYLLLEKLLTKNTIGYRIKVLKTILNDATDKGLNKNLEFQKRGFKKWTEEADNIYLTETELKKIFELDLSKNARLDKVRDLFIVGSYTGLRFSDFTALDRATITEQTIRIRTQKTGEIVEIPKHPYVRHILNKYENQVPIPLSNQKMNSYLKELGEEAKINDSISIKEAKAGKTIHKTYKKYEKISSHTARRSFASNAFLAGIPAISIMKITGHETEKAFLSYIKISAEENARIIQMHPFFNPVMNSDLKVVAL